MICSKCGADNDPEAENCAKCGWRLRSQLAVDEQVCANHPWRLAVSTCHACGLELCEECEVFLDGRAYCRECADQPGEDELLRNVRMVDPERADPAGFAVRLLAAAIDALILASALAVLSITFWLAFGDPTVPFSREEHPWAHAFFWAIAAVGTLFYFIHSVAVGAQTPGMAAVDIAVVRETGEAPDYRTAILRYLAMFPSALSVVGILWCIWDRRKRTLHDRLTRTRVVRMG